MLSRRPPRQELGLTSCEQRQGHVWLGAGRWRALHPGMCRARALTCALNGIFLSPPSLWTSGYQSSVFLTCAASAQVDIGDNDAAMPPAVPEEAVHEIPKPTCRTSNERQK